MKMELDRLSMEELKALKARLDKAIPEKRESALAETKAAVEALVKESGFSMQEVVGYRRRRRAG